MPRPVSRCLSVAAVCVVAGVAAAPAQAFTPPIGTDKGSVTKSPVPVPPTPAGIIAILIG